MSSRVSPASSMARRHGVEGEVERVAVDAPADLRLADAGDDGAPARPRPSRRHHRDRARRTAATRRRTARTTTRTGMPMRTSSGSQPTMLVVSRSAVLLGQLDDGDDVGRVEARVPRLVVDREGVHAPRARRGLGRERRVPRHAGQTGAGGWIQEPQASAAQEAQLAVLAAGPEVRVGVVDRAAGPGTAWGSSLIGLTGGRHGSRGRPSRRSAMTLRWISLVPPAIDEAAVAEEAADPRRRRRRRRRRAAGAEQREARPPAPAGRARRRAACARSPPGPGSAPASARSVVRSAERGERLRVGQRGRRPSSSDERRRRPADARTRPSSASTPEPERRARAHRHPLVGERRAGRAPSRRRRAPTTQSSGTNTSVEEDLVEHRRAPVSSRSGRMSMPWRRHVDHEARDAVVLRARRGRCGRGRCPSRPRRAIDVHTFCPVSSQPPSTRTALVVSDGEVGAGARLAEQLAPRDLAAQRRAGPSAPAARRCRGR